MGPIVTQVQWMYLFLMWFYHCKMPSRVETIWWRVEDGVYTRIGQINTVRSGRHLGLVLVWEGEQKKWVSGGCRLLHHTPRGWAAMDNNDWWLVSGGLVPASTLRLLSLSTLRLVLVEINYMLRSFWHLSVSFTELNLEPDLWPDLFSTKSTLTVFLSSKFRGIHTYISPCVPKRLITVYNIKY